MSRVWRMRLAPLAYAIVIGIAAAHLDPALALSASSPSDTAHGSLPVPGLNIVELSGPVRSAWLSTLRGNGVRPVHYLGDYHYLVWANGDSALQRLSELPSRTTWLRSIRAFDADRKLEASLRAAPAGTSAQDEIAVVIQVYRHGNWSSTRRLLESLARVPMAQQAPAGQSSANPEWSEVLDYANVTLLLRRDDLLRVAALPDVTFIGPKLEMRQYDEKQNLILAGHLSPHAQSPDYLETLIDLGFSQNPDDYPIVDVVDSPIHEGGSGAGVVATADSMLRTGGNLLGASRVVSFRNCSSRPDSAVYATDGHGSLNAGIVAGWDQAAGWPWQDTDGHQLGLGVNPFGRIASTAIFVPQHSVANCGNDETGLIRDTWLRGALISSNSWGSVPPPTTYETGAQAYDAGVRDADPQTPGNQQQIILFAAGNDGSRAASIGAPGTGKNVITVGASENVRPQWIDGCGAGPLDADNANDIATFSSRGPAPGQRVKPEFVAPGTHVQARASIHPSYLDIGTGVCDRYYPQGQTIFAASSGTSHSTPAVAGLVSLVWHWLQSDGQGSIQALSGTRPPSPAAMKAWLMAHPIWLNGVSSGDSLPSNNQGYGMPDLASMFDQTNKVMLDQSVVFHDSGEQWQATWAASDPTKPVRITLAWTDAPGMVGVQPQVNDLDLSIVASGQNDIWRGNRFNGGWSIPGGAADRFNNYEAVFLPAGMAGSMGITVDAHNIAGIGVPGTGDGASQDFAVVCYNCTAQPEFRLSSDQARPQACVDTPSQVPLQLGSILGFASPVQLQATSASELALSFTGNPVSPPGSTALVVSANEAASVGEHLIRVDGQSGQQTRSLSLPLSVYAERPDEPELLTPAVAAVTEATPTFSWNPVAGAHVYRLEISTDRYFKNIVMAPEVNGTAWTVPDDAPLASSRSYWWRVVATNACGESLVTPPGDTIFRDDFDIAADARAFITASQPGDCALDIPATTVFSDDIEQGVAGWSSGAAAGHNNTWRRSAELVHSGGFAWVADNPDAINDQWLVSPAINLPSIGLNTLSLQFRNHRALSSQGSSCLDGITLEIGVNGAAWAPVSVGILSDPYDGTIASLFSNPLGARKAWCGSPQEWRKTVVDLQPYAGAEVRLRFRLGSDNRIPARTTAWSLDDVRISACPTD